MKHLPIENKLQIFFVSLTILVSLAYVAITNHVWEDFYITFKHSKNLVEGHGLVYNPGERVHGFTSVINTLLPALYYWVSGESFSAAIWLYRLSSIVALVFGGIFFLREIIKQNPESIFVPVVFTVLFAFETKTIMFATNGQEAGFMLLFLLPAVILAYRGFKDNWLWIGICWAGLIYTRPDAPVYIFILSMASVLFGQKSKEDLISIIKAGTVCAVLYLPWFIGVWLYYGSPVPHTVTAKAGLGYSFTENIFSSILVVLGLLPKVGPIVFEPVNSHFGGWPVWTKAYAFIGWLVCAVYWLLPTKDQLGRFVSFLFAGLSIYFALLQFKGSVYAWYFPPMAILGMFVISSAIFHACNSYRKKYIFLPVLIVLPFVISSVSIFYLTFNQIIVQQTLIETNHRKQIGLWINHYKKEGDTVFLEPLGYIGYFSDGKMRDWPGLVSPEVVAAEKHKKAYDFENILKKVKPVWLVLRPPSYDRLTKSEWFNNNYKPVKEFNVRNEIDRYGDIVGKGYLYFDAIFVVFKRIPDA